MGRDIFYRSSCWNATRQPYKLSQTLKVRHSICHVLFSQVSILTTHFPQPTLDPCLSLLPNSSVTWQKMLQVQGEKSACIVILFLWCTPTPALKHRFALIHPSFPIWCHQHTCQLCYFSPRGGTDWPSCRREWETGTLIRLMALISLSPVLWGERDAVWRRQHKGVGRLRGTEHSPTCSIASPSSQPAGCSRELQHCRLQKMKYQGPAAAAHWNCWLMSLINV